jgi:hypothetical protein
VYDALTIFMTTTFFTLAIGLEQLLTDTERKRIKSPSFAWASDARRKRTRSNMNGMKLSAETLQVVVLFWIKIDH